MSEKNTSNRKAEMDKNITKKCLAIMKNESQENREETSDEELAKLFKFLTPSTYKEKLRKNQEEMKKLKAVVTNLKDTMMTMQSDLSKEEKEEAAKTIADIEHLTIMQSHLTDKLQSLNALMLTEKAKLLQKNQGGADKGNEEDGPSGSANIS